MSHTIGSLQFDEKPAVTTHRRECTMRSGLVRGPRGSTLALLAGLALVGAFVVAGCGGDDGGSSGGETGGGGGDYRFGLVLPGFASNPFIADIAESAEAAAEEAGVELLVTGSNDPAGQVNAMQNYINAQVDVLGYDSIDATAMGTAVVDANDAGIPTISIVSGTVEGDDLDATHIEANWHDAGEMVGELIGSEWCADKDPCEVGIVQGALTDRVGMSGDEGIRTGLATGETVEIVAAAPTNYDSTEALNVSQNMITANPGLDFIVTWWSNGSLSALEAVRSANKLGEIGVASISGACPDLQAVIKGEMFADVMMFPERMGTLFVEQALAVANGDEIDKITPTPLYPITTEQAQALLDGSEEAPEDLPEVMEHLEQAEAGDC